MFEKGFKEICLVGYYGFGNIGDDAILISALNEYTKAYDIYVRVLANKDPYLERMLKNFELDSKVVIYDRWKSRDINDAIYYSDALVFGGGGIFQDKTSLKSFLYYFYLALLAKMYKKPIIIERNSIGPLNSKISKFLFNFVLQWAEKVSVRDNDSLNFLNQFYPKFSIKYSLKQDFVLSDISSDIFKRSLLTEKIEVGKYDVLFILRNFSRIQEFANLIKELNEKYKVKVIVFQENDVDDLKVYFSDIEYPGKGEIYKTLAIIQSSSLVISNRLHGLIFSYLRNVECIGISVDPKIEGFCKDYNIEFLDEKNPELINIIKEKINNKLEGIVY